MKSFRNEGAEQSEPALTDAGGPNSQVHTDIVLEDLLANSADALVVLDRDGRVTYLNHEAARTVKFPAFISPRVHRTRSTRQTLMRGG